VIRWLRDNLSTLVLAIFLSLIVWASAVNSADPTQERRFGDGLEIEYLGLADGLTFVGTPPVQATAVLRAPRSLLDQLSAQEIHIVADLGGRAAGRHEIPLVGSVDRRPARVISIEPQTAVVELEAIARQDVPVQVLTLGTPAIGYRVVTPLVSPDQVAAVGPASAMAQLAYALAEVTVSDQRQDIDQTVRLIPADASGQAIEGIQLEPDTARLTAAIERLGGYREVAVKLVIEGEVAPGYSLARLTISPPVVTVYSSNADAVAVLPGFVETEPLVLTGASANFELRLSLDLPQGIAPVGEQTVLVQVEIAAIESTINLTLPLEIQGLGTGLFAEASPDTINVILRGPVSALAELQPDDVRVVLDLLNLGIGSHQVIPQVVVLPAGVVTQTLLPATIEVTIRTTPPDTATP
jgi:YbbR domain-containing protein